jgi:hypothetical protein
MSLFANPEVQSYIDKLIGGATPSAGGGVRGGNNALANALAGIVRPEMAAASPAPQIRQSGFRPEVAQGGGPRGLMGQSVMPVPSIGSSAGGLGGGALASGIQQLGAGIEGGLQALAEKRKAAQEAAALGQGGAFPKFGGGVVGAPDGAAAPSSPSDLPSFARQPGVNSETPSGGPGGAGVGGGNIAALRFNNPGNISLPMKDWTGGGSIVGLKGQPGYAAFPDMATGMAAFTHRVGNYINDRGLNTIAALNSVYAQDSKWGAGVSRASGIDLHTPIDTSNAAQMSALHKGILTQEMGAANAAAVLNKTTAQDHAQDVRQDAQDSGVPPSVPILGGATSTGTYDGQPYTFQTQPAIGPRADMAAPPDPLALALAGSQMPTIDPNFGGWGGGFFG